MKPEDLTLLEGLWQMFDQKSKQASATESFNSLMGKTDAANQYCGETEAYRDAKMELERVIDKIKED